MALVSCIRKTTAAGEARPGRLLRRFFSWTGLCPLLLKSGRGIHPQDPCFLFARVHPPMMRAAFEIEAITLFEAKGFTVIERDFETATHDEEEFLALMRVGFSAAGSRGDPKEMRLHHGISPR